MTHRLRDFFETILPEENATVREYSSWADSSAKCYDGPRMLWGGGGGGESKKNLTADFI